MFNHSGTIATLELSVCHRTNLVKSKQYKDQKYELLGADLKLALHNFLLRRHTFEVDEQEYK